MQSSTMAAVAGGLACVLCSAIPAHAQLTYTGATRSLSARVGAGGAGPSDSQSNNTLANTDFFAEAILEGPPFTGSARSHSATTLSPLLCAIQGDFVLNRPAAAGTGTAFASQSLRFTFDSPASDFVLSGTMPIQALRDDPRYTPPLRSIRLTGPGVNIDLDGPNAFSIPGHFTGGSYELQVNIETWNYGFAVPFEAIAGFDTSLAVPAPTGLAAMTVLGGLLSRRRRR